MDAPPIQYCRTADGANIAYWTLGDGPPALLVLSPRYCHVGLEWAVPRFRRFYQALASGLQVIRYNPRGVGLSDGTYSTDKDGILQDVAAVLEAVGAETVAVIACGSMAKGTVAAYHAPRASAFVALAPLADPMPMITVNRTLAEQTPEHSAMMIARTMDPDSLEPSEPLVALLEGAMGVEDVRRTFPTLEPPRDGVGWLEPTRIQAPTLVVHYPDEAMYQGGPEVARAIDGAHLVVRSGRGFPFFEPDVDGLAELVRDFVLANAATPDAGASARSNPAGHPEMRQSSLPQATRALSGRSSYPDGLSEREVQVLRLVGTGMTNRQVADQLILSHHTVAKHVSNILAKTGLSNRTEAAAYAISHDLLPPEVAD